MTPIYPPIEAHDARNWRGWFAPWREVRSRGDLQKNVSELMRRNRLYNHIPARFARARLPRNVWRSYYKVCVERNPWDKTLSHYHMFKNASWHRHYDPELTLDRYLKNGRFCHNAPFYCDTHGQLLVDRVLRYDRLDEELTDLFTQLGLPFEGLPHAKGDLRKDRTSYKDVFTPDQAKQIGRAFQNEIKLHGWEF